MRYGNVLGSRGSVVPLFQRLIREGRNRLPVTDARMTRFWITIGQGVDFVLEGLERMSGGEIFVPKLPSMKIVDLARALLPGCEIEIVGVRPGEKLHEVMIPADDARVTLEYDDHYVIQPSFHDWRPDDYMKANGGRPVAEEFEYSSHANDRWLVADDLKRYLGHDG